MFFLRKLKCCFLLVCALLCIRANAHSLPNTFAQIIVQENRVLVQFNTPVDILELASKLQIDLKLPALQDSIKKYYLQHISVSDSLNSSWQITVDTLYIHPTSDKAVGKYDEIIAKVYLIPSKNKSLYNFLLNCDLVIHQVANQSILFSAKQQSNNRAEQVGSISADYASGKILPIKIQLNKTSSFTSFQNMMLLGMQHIKEGTDHLLFIITLLLPACLLANQKKWTSYAGFKTSLFKLLKIITAFTLGHSITLIIGSLNIIKIPTQIIEVTIAFSILVSAIHAIKPLFYNKEIFVAIGFGFIHGLAFSQTLQTLQLAKLDLAISVLGFNLGIEAMQIFIILITIPWFILLSKTSSFKIIKNILATFVSLAAIGWIIQRITNSSNILSNATDKLFLFSPWLIVGIAAAGIALFFIDKKKCQFKLN